MTVGRAAVVAVVVSACLSACGPSTDDEIADLCGDLDSFAEGYMAVFLGGVDVDASFGDTRIVVFLSERTKLPLRMLVDQSMEIEGETMEMHMELALMNLNEPVDIPNPGA